MNGDIVLAITGGSGAIYALRLLEVLIAHDEIVHLSISESGREVIRQELGLEVELDRAHFDLAQLLPSADAIASDPKLQRLADWGIEGSFTSRATSGPTEREANSAANIPAKGTAKEGRVVYHNFRNFLAPIASGSFLTRGMVICPCSGSTLSGIAHAASQNLIQRAADVHLKERRKLILVPRETPLSLLQIDNMKRCAEAGAVILPAMPGFYHDVKCVRDLVDFVVARILDQLGVEHKLMRRWGE